MAWAAFAGFFVAVLPLVLTPGASFTLTTQRTLSGQPHAAGWVIAGTATGIYAHALLAAAGLSVVVMRSAEAFTTVKIVGGLYLMGLGLLTLWQTRHRPGAGSATSRPARRLPWARNSLYLQAVLANVLNPKAASVYLTLAPQFLDAQYVSVGAFLALASAHVVAMALWLAAWSGLLARGRRATVTEQLSVVVNRVGGAVLIALGIRTAATA